MTGGGGAGYVDDDMTTSKFNYPLGVSVDNVNGICYVADFDNHCIRTFPFN